MSKLNGLNLLFCPKMNKDLAFTTEERDAHRLTGLLPAAVRTMEEQARAEMDCIELLGDNSLAKYMYLRDLQDRNRRLFYKLLQTYGPQVLPLVYTPTVGLACQQYSLVCRRARGLFLTAQHAGRIGDVLANYPVKDIRAIVVTDGERILGLGDLGANGMGIPVGKIALYTAVGGVPPSQTLPITIDVGTNTESILSDPHYIGLRQKRLTGPAYDSLLDEFMEAVAKRYGRTCLVQFEDFGNRNAWRLLRRYQNKYCTFNDDIQGTAAVAVAGVLASLSTTKTKLSQNRVLFLGAGEAALGIADLLVMAMQKDEGLSAEDARTRLFLIDSKGLITTECPRNDAHKDSYAKSLTSSTDLLSIVNLVRPTVLIGAAAQPGAFTAEVLAKMAELNAIPVIFALSNPTSKAECTAEQAYTATAGKALFASGSPFAPVTFDGRTLKPGQANNLYIFPAVAAAIVVCRMQTVPEEVFLVAAKALAAQLLPVHQESGALYPPLESIHATSLSVAARVAEWFYSKKLAHAKPEPSDKVKFVQSKLYEASYDTA